MNTIQDSQVILLNKKDSNNTENKGKRGKLINAYFLSLVNSILQQKSERYRSETEIINCITADMAPRKRQTPMMLIISAHFL